MKKEEVRLHYSISRNLAETAKAFGINESTVRGLIKAPPVLDNVKHSSKCNFPGAGWRLNYPVEQDDKLITWILALQDLHFPVFVLSFREKEKLLIQPDNPSFPASCGWVDKFLTRHKLALQSRTWIKSNTSILIKF